MKRNLQVNAERILCALLVLCLCIALVPILRAGLSARPAADDYSFSYRTYQALGEGGGFFGVLSAAFEEVKSIYVSWQGTYSAIFLFSLQPGIFGLYPVTTFLLVGLLAFSVIFFLATLGKIFDLQRSGRGRRTILLFCAALLMMLEFLPDVREGYYWWNGAIYYTAFFSLSLILLCLVLRLLSGTKALGLTVGSCLLAFFIAGGNYTTALITAEILMLLVIAAFLFLPRDGARKKRLFCLLLVTLVLLAGFAVSILAPGNSVRGSQTGGLGAAAAIGAAFAESIGLLASYAGFPMALYALFCLLVFLCSGFRTKQISHPVLTLFLGTLLLYLLFVSGIVPPLYGIGDIGAGRQQNIYYHFVIVMVPLWCGLFVSCLQNVLDRKQGFFRGAVVLSGVLFVGLFVLTGIVFDFSGTTTFTAVREEESGALSAYAAQYDTLIESITSSEEDTVTVEPLTDTPDLFPALGLESGEDGWVNIAMARYFGKSAIEVQ